MKFQDGTVYYGQARDEDDRHQLAKQGGRVLASLYTQEWIDEWNEFWRQPLIQNILQLEVQRFRTM